MNSYARFYALLRLLPSYGDEEALKLQLVSQASHGRTTSLRELTSEEYHDLCSTMEEATGQRKLLRQARSLTLRLMQKVGVNTPDWKAVDAFCLQKRIAGQRFAHMDLIELAALQRKLRAIYQKQQRQGI